MSTGKKWIKKAIRKPGAFKAQARRAGDDNTFAFARQVIRTPGRHSETTLRRARLALQLEKYQKRRRKSNPPKGANKPRRKKAMARRRRRRRSAPRRRNAQGMRLGNVGKVLAIAAGAVAATQVDFLKRPISAGQLPVTWAAVAGGFLLMRGRGQLQKHLGIGMLLGGGVQTAVNSALAPALSGVGGRSARGFAPNQVPNIAPGG